MAFPAAEVPYTAPGRALLTLLLVLVLLTTTGWPATGNDSGRDSREAALARWHKGSIAGRKLPDTNSSPKALERFFSTLTTAQRHRLADRHPLIVGNTDGAPVQLRYRANHKAIRDARDMAQRQADKPRLTADAQHVAERRADRLSALLKDGRQILAFDPTGRGKAAEVFGDLSHAERVSVIVPGIGTELLTFERSNREYAAPVGMARAVHAKQRAMTPEVRTATVAWAGYNAPDGLGIEAASSARAEEGATQLIDFVTGDLPSSGRVALLCHSYGSVTCGAAADRLPRRVTDIAVAGSPGMGTTSTNALRTEARIWAMRNSEDWISSVPHLRFAGLGHGTDPVDAGFGAREVSAKGAAGHAGYFVPGTRSLTNLSAIGAGESPHVRCALDDPDCASRNG
ncbi:hypothetical protein AN216_13865 [Streptomyces oceani]|uniref:DUF1023 domain-containing protein n=1 Tax=Streptomyces oceani TaxID=1075402 RepID=A0A1E7KFC8_9ACTN|nr:hypothetical protein AN216_13865 [Streptomyces oceani]